MEKLRRKLKDSRGATIILALLFLLLCMMVAATLLMAAVSNAGKAQRSRAEQQKHPPWTWSGWNWRRRSTVGGTAMGKRRCWTSGR